MPSHKDPPQVFDAYGTEIREGARVAYNYSGSVRFGYVEKIIPSVSSYRPLGVKFRIHQYEPKHGYDRNLGSLVTSKDNLVVLMEEHVQILNKPIKGNAPKSEKVLA